jgi:catechol 2,3-dioxygenase-like lactoylglutathione lyase family enzyme
MGHEPSPSPPVLLGMRHLALRVKDLPRARAFYEGVLGMKVVWEPDPQNVYLSSGSDNLALHEVPTDQKAGFRGGPDQPLDHLGFIAGSPEAVEAAYAAMVTAGAKITKPIKKHRDGSHSFYMADPEGNIIQVLFEPHISPLKIQKYSG